MSTIASLLSDISLSGTQYVNQGSVINLTCNATGGIHAPLGIDWFFKGKRIQTTQSQWKDRIQILKRKKGRYYISDLIIGRSTMNDQGTYVCRSTDFRNQKEVKGFTIHILSGKFLIMSSIIFSNNTNIKM